MTREAAREKEATDLLLGDKVDSFIDFTEASAAYFSRHFPSFLLWMYGIRRGNQEQDQEQEQEQEQ